MKLQFLLNLYNSYTVFQDLITTSFHRSEIFCNSLFDSYSDLILDLVKHISIRVIRDGLPPGNVKYNFILMIPYKSHKAKETIRVMIRPSSTLIKHQLPYVAAIVQVLNAWLSCGNLENHHSFILLKKLLPPTYTTFLLTS